MQIEGEFMKKKILLTIISVLILISVGCSKSDVAVDTVNSKEEAESTGVTTDYPAAIMVDGSVYLLSGTPMPAKVDADAVIGYTESYTDTFPEKNGETNFNSELDMPYAKVEGGIAILYQNEWYLCTPRDTEINWDNLSEEEKMAQDPTYNAE